MSFVAAGIGAGLVSALLFSVVITGSLLGVLLLYFAALPIYIASLGWRHVAGLVACGVAAAVIGGVFSLYAGAGFLIAFGLPAGGISYLSLLGRTDGHGHTEWYPVGRLLLWMVGSAALIMLVTTMLISGNHADFVAGMQRSFARVVSGEMPGVPRVTLPQGMTTEAFVAILVSWAPFVAAASMVPFLVLNMWIAAKTLSLSGRLPRPWPLLPGTVMPREALLVMLGGVAMAMTGGFIGFFGMAILGGLAVAFLFTGLAALHEATLGKRWRFPALLGVYVSVLFAGPLPLLLVSLFGVADTAFGFRAKSGSPPQTPQPPTI
jgi:hypothetical protein